MTKTILITGANRGIGLELASQYSTLGWKVIACCRVPNHADELKQLPIFAVHKLDVTKAEDIESLVECFKDTPIDILVNNAGVEGPSNEEISKTDPSIWLKTFEVNTIAPYLIAKALSKQVGKSVSKLIVNMSSSYGSIGLNKEKNDYVVYRTSKSALNAATKCLANELRSLGIIVLAMHPGSVKTDLNPDGRAHVSESVRDMRNVFNSITQKESGSFLDYLGQRLPW